MTLEAHDARRYAGVLQRELIDLGPTPAPPTRPVYGMERIPVLPPRRVTGGLRLPTVGYGKAKQPKEVFDDEFYDIFPWASGVDPFDESRTEWEPAEWYVENEIELGKGLPPDRNAEVPPAIAFIDKLISLELDDLEKGDRRCAICLQPYREGETQEIPLQLPCGHIFGKECLLSWLSDIGDDGAHAACCPMCRKECISEKRKHIGTYEGLKQLLRDTNYLLTGMRGLSLTQEGRDDWEDVMAYVNEYLAEIEDLKQERLKIFMRKLREGLRDFPVTVAPATVKAIGRDVVALRQTTSQLLTELEQRGIIGTYLNMLDVDTDEGEEAETHARLVDTIPGPLLNYMDEVYAEGYNPISEDEGFPEADTETLHNGGMSGLVEDNGAMADTTLYEGIGVTEPGRDDSTVTGEVLSDQVDAGASRTGRNETHHWTWLGSDDLDMENVQMSSDNEDLPDGDDERAVRLLGRRVRDTYDAVMRNRPQRRTR